MAFIEMTCKCECSFQADVAEVGSETLVILWATQFVNSHAACGFMNTVKTDVPETHRIIEWDSDVKYKESHKKDID